MINDFMQGIRGGVLPTMIAPPPLQATLATVQWVLLPALAPLRPSTFNSSESLNA
jgi:hypothetical protein